MYVSGIVLGHKKKVLMPGYRINVDCYNLEEPQIYYANGKKPGTKGYILHDSIYMLYQE